MLFCLFLLCLGNSRKYFATEGDCSVYIWMNDIDTDNVFVQTYKIHIKTKQKNVQKKSS